MNKFILSSLNHTWILDLDGTVVKHNGYKIDGEDTLLPGVREFFDNLDVNDMVIFVTSREEQYRKLTEKFLKENNIRYNYIIFGAPYGERIIINDNKPSGLVMSKSVSLSRDEGFDFCVEVNTIVK